MGTLVNKNVTAHFINTAGDDILTVTGSEDAVLDAFYATRQAVTYRVEKSSAAYRSSDGRVTALEDMSNQHLANAILKLWRESIAPATVRLYRGGDESASKRMVEHLFWIPGTHEADPAYDNTYSALVGEARRRGWDLPF